MKIIKLGKKTKYSGEKSQKFCLLKKNKINFCDGFILSIETCKIIKDDEKKASKILKSIVKNFDNFNLSLVSDSQGVDCGLLNFYGIDSIENLREKIKLAIDFWDSKKAKVLRKLYGQSDENKMSIILQAEEETKEFLSRDERTGEKLYQNDNYLKSFSLNEKTQNLLKNIIKTIENACKSAVKVYFCVKNEQIYVKDFEEQKISQNAKIEVLHDLLIDNIIDKYAFIDKISKQMVESLLYPQFDKNNLANAKKIGKGLGVSQGCACGNVCFSVFRAQDRIKKGERVILFTEEISPQEIEKMKSLQGVITVKGGTTSHASVIARTLGLPCIAGVKDVDKLKSKLLREGKTISIDGATGEIFEGDIKILSASKNQILADIINISKEISNIKVYANADNEKSAAIADSLGAEGIGLCRTEHMFFEREKINFMRQMILSSTLEEREKALKNLFPYQKKEFAEIFEKMKGKSVTIRLLDPPLHEFLPKTLLEMKSLSLITKKSVDEIKEKITKIQEVNPMLGHRGIRLFITYPEIAKMQTRAIIEAAIATNKKFGYQIAPKIMIPITSDDKEFSYVKSIICEEIENILNEKNAKIDYSIGTMIEIPRACLIADKIAKEAKFFSFGTNDLTQTTYGLSRDDCNKIIDAYMQKEIYDFNPFKTLDQNGVGQFMAIAALQARKENEKIEIGICGEQGTDSNAIEFLKKLGISYISCTPYKIPVVYLMLAKSCLNKN